MGQEYDKKIEGITTENISSKKQISPQYQKHLPPKKKQQKQQQHNNA